jgi:hypothetical protein
VTRDAPDDGLKQAEAHLRELLATGRVSKRGSATGDRDDLPASAWDAVERLRSHGREATALALLERIADARSGDAELALHLGELFLEARDPRAVPCLESVSAHRLQRARAQAALGAHFSQEGDPSRALACYEAALAVDIDHPRALERARGLRAQLGLPENVHAGATLLGPEGLPAGRHRYRLVRELGRGATATVYLAHDSELGLDLALKLLHPHLASAAAAPERGRFFSEARIAASLRAPGVIAIYDLDEPLGLLAMELCAGGSLAARFKQGRFEPVVSWRRAVELFDVLATLHAEGVVHGDLKPGNLLARHTFDDPLDPMVISDFGVARLIHASGAPGDESPRWGTPVYMAPERHSGASPGAPADVFAAAVIAHQVLTGTLPFDASASAARLGGRSSVRLAPVPSLGVDRARDWLAVMGSALAESPVARPPAVEIRDRLRDLAGSRRVPTISGS